MARVKAEERGVGGSGQGGALRMELIILIHGKLLAGSLLRGSLHGRAQIANSLIQLDG